VGLHKSKCINPSFLHVMEVDVGRIKLDNHKTGKYLYIICLKYI
jgi:hypothetical protein